MTRFFSPIATGNNAFIKASPSLWQLVPGAWNDKRSSAPYNGLEADCTVPCAGLGILSLNLYETSSISENHNRIFCIFEEIFLM